jgi:Chromo (CHRromatin Organisation MOdifier) domain
VHNSWENASTGYTPFELLLGYTPSIHPSHEKTFVPAVEQRREWLEQVRRQANAAIKEAQQMLVKHVERKKGQCHYQGHEEGDRVWLEGTNLKRTHPKAKLDAKRYGPFTITKKVSPVVFKLELPSHWQIHNVFHVLLLTPYKETEEHGRNFAQPALELIEGEEEYEVEQVLNSRRWGRGWKLQYLLRWKGYSHAHNSWQDAADMHAPDLVAEYHRRKPSGVQTIQIKEQENEEKLHHRPMYSPHHDSAQAQDQTTGDPAQLAPPSSVTRTNSPCSPHDDSVLFLFDQGYHAGSDANRSWYEQQQGGQPSSLSKGRSATRVINIEDDEYPFSQSLRDTALSPTPSIATSFTDISYSEATTRFSMPHFTASISGSDAAAPRPTTPEPATPDSAIFAWAADQLAATLEEDIRAAELGAAG